MDGTTPIYLSAQLTQTEDIFFTLGHSLPAADLVFPLLSQSKVCCFIHLFFSFLSLSFFLSFSLTDCHVLATEPTNEQAIIAIVT